MIKTDGIILDIDGTLWDSTGIVAKAWRRALDELGMTEAVVTPDILKSLFGKPMTEIAEAILPGRTEEERAEMLEICEAYEQEELRLNADSSIVFEGVAETIRKLSVEYRMFIVSNCQKGYIELVMDKTGIRDCISDFESFGNTGKMKDENIKLVAERSGLSAPVYVGDTAGDLQACTKAGIPFIYAEYGFGHADRYDAKIRSFRELAGIVMHI